MLDLSSFEEKLGDWFPRLKPFLETKEAEDIYTHLKKRSSEKHTILPSSKDTYKAFKLCPPDRVNAILIGMSPYHTLNKKQQPYADGLCFSSQTNEEPPNLKLFYDGMSDNLGRKVKRHPDLSYLAHQGVLMLNASFTCELYKASIHNDIGLWNNFNKYLYTEVLSSFCGIPIITFGAEAKKIANSYLFKLCHVVKEVEHPAFAARQNREWHHNKCFTWANEIITQNNGLMNTIEWDYEEWQTLPF